MTETPEPIVHMNHSTDPEGSGYYVELGDQHFTQHQWELIQLYADGNARAREFERQLDADQRVRDMFEEDEFIGNLSTAVFEALGAVSMCWEERVVVVEEGKYGRPDVTRKERVFESSRARAIGETLLDYIRAYFKGHKAQRQNAAFHKAFGIETAGVPRAIPAEDVPVVIELIREEFIDELIPALGFKVTFTHDGHFDTIEKVSEPNVVEIYDAFIDILYVTYGGMNRAGMNAEPGYDEVQGSNMSKLGEDGKAIIAGPNDPDGVFEGRVKKGPNYFKPNLALVLQRQGWLSDFPAVGGILTDGYDDHQDH